MTNETAVKLKTVEEICLQCGGEKKQKLSIVIDGPGAITDDHYQVLKCNKGHYEVKNNKGELTIYHFNKNF